MANRIMTNVNPPTSYQDGAARVAVSKNQRSDGMLYLDYIKGDETSIELQLEYSHKGDVEGSEVWFAESVGSSANPSVVAVKQYQFTATGKYRLPIPGSYAEDKIRISFKRTGGVAPGTITVDHQI